MVNKVGSASSQIYSLEEVLIRQKGGEVLACAKEAALPEPLAEYAAVHVCMCTSESVSFH